MKRAVRIHISPVIFAEFASSDFHHRIGDQPQAETSGDAKGQRSGEHGNEGQNRLTELAPFDARPPSISCLMVVWFSASLK
jgi:hypothetical protein